ncbi:site-2 protease family protein [Neolewinella agarilytica]|uniref:Peptidase M50 domain-containing protein n=1 Tax=Neolewinella agarilytica TaxID=478744 RepID=A0A1H9MCT0_9BACT|nr:site-2 protease family protein [Neolewinella agarilytica]SER21257.1 hypothetical protein SAMN05444359_12842 [Neolewinella agarilytica]
MKKILSFAGLLIMGGMIGYLGAKFFLSGSDTETASLLPGNSKVYLILLLPLMYLLVVGIHELGHVVAGKTQNFDFFGLTVGPFSWKPKDSGGIRFAWNKSLNLAGGVAMMLPNGDHRLRQRFMWFAAGGPLASLLLLGFCFLIGNLLPEGTFVRFLLFALGAFSGAIFIATILPFRAGGFASDGLRIINFARNGPTAAADLAGLQAMTHLRSGRPHEDLPADSFATVAADTSIPAQQRVTMDYYRYLHALGVNNIPQAAALLESVMGRLDEYPPGSHGGFYLEQAIFEAQYRKDLAAAEAALAQYEDSPFTESLSLPLTRATIANLRGDRAAVLAEIPAIEAALPKSMDQSRVPIIRQWVADWKA